MSSAAILTDTTLCTGCESCVKACKRENDLGADRPWRQTGAIDDLSSTRYTTIVRRPGGHNVRKQCRHCLEPACVSACLVGAMQKTPEGPVIYDRQRCMGCRYCMVACPYEIPRYDWDKAVPGVRKCTMCYDRLQAGKIPACVEGCPEKATIFGSREAMLAEARKRIEASPDKYLSEIYGEHVVGGTSVLYISNYPLDFLRAKPEMDDTPVPELTAKALHVVPPAIVTVGAVMTGIYWIIGRRMRMQALAAADAASTADGSAETPRTDDEEQE
jgi:formate dehydrogenase iron-sulfur subunit